MDQVRILTQDKQNTREKSQEIDFCWWALGNHVQEIQILRTQWWRHNPFAAL